MQATSYSVVKSQVRTGLVAFLTPFIGFIPCGNVMFLFLVLITLIVLFIFFTAQYPVTLLPPIIAQMKVRCEVG